MTSIPPSSRRSTKDDLFLFGICIGIVIGFSAALFASLF